MRYEYAREALSLTVGSFLIAGAALAVDRAACRAGLCGWASVAVLVLGVLALQTWRASRRAARINAAIEEHLRKWRRP